MGRLHNTLADRIVVRIFAKSRFFFDHIGQIFADGRCTGKSRRLDSRRIEESRCILRLADDEIIAILMGAQTGERGDDLTERNVVDTLRRLVARLCQSFGRRVGSFLVLLIDCGRSD